MRCSRVEEKVGVAGATLDVLNPALTDPVPSPRPNGLKNMFTISLLVTAGVDMVIVD